MEASRGDGVNLGRDLKRKVMIARVPGAGMIDVEEWLPHAHRQPGSRRPWAVGSIE
jgi:hypothetical protein